MFRELLQKLTYFRKKSFDSELDDEIGFHIESRAEELELAGLTRAQALTQARREFGRTSAIGAQSREAWTFRWIEDLSSDLRYATRAFRRDPGFALAAVLSLSLGIGVNTTIFSLTTEFLFSDPSCRDATTLRAIRIGGNSHSPVREVRLLRDLKPLEDIAGIRENGELNWRRGDESNRLFAGIVTENYFDVVGAAVAQGRPIQRGDSGVAVVTHRFWQARLSGTADVVGRPLILDGRPHTIIGILPSDHRTLVGFGFSPDLYVPIHGDGTSLALYARLPAGMSGHQAGERLKAAAQQLDRVYPNEHITWANNIRVTNIAGIDRLNDEFFVAIASFFVMLMTVVGLLLVIACANVASLLLARASSRSQEFAIRLCIGANRGRIVRQLLAESLLLALLGTAAGLALNLWLTSLVSRIELPIPVPIRILIQPDYRLLLYCVAVAIVSAILAGLAPALRATRADANPELKRGERQVGGRINLRNVLVAGQLAISIIVLSTAFLFLRNLLRSTAMNPGFDVDRVVWAHMRLVPERYAAAAKLHSVVASALDSIRSLPGIEAASVARVVPLNDQHTRGAGVRTDVSKEPVHVRYVQNRVGPDYFRTMGIGILAGREFLPSDRAGAPRVVIINESFSRRVFAAGNPVGHTITLGDTTVSVVGLARDSKYFTLGESDKPALYEAYLQSPYDENVHLFIRAAANPEMLIRPLNSTLFSLDSSAAIEVKPMTRALGLALLPSRAGAGLLGAIGLLGLVLASVGLYGVLVYAVNRRIREIGLRVALGARRADIIRMVLAEGGWLVASGIAAGIATSLFVTRPLAIFLVPGLRPEDPLTYVAVAGVLAVAGLAACLRPTLRALRVDPMTALRYE